jgi:hypothetical protein
MLVFTRAGETVHVNLLPELPSTSCSLIFSATSLFTLSMIGRYRVPRSALSLERESRLERSFERRERRERD